METSNEEDSVKGRFQLKSDICGKPWPNQVSIETIYKNKRIIYHQNGVMNLQTPDEIKSGRCFEFQEYINNFHDLTFPKNNKSEDSYMTSNNFGTVLPQVPSLDTPAHHHIRFC